MEKAQKVVHGAPSFLLLAAVFLIPFFFILGSGFSLEMAKMTLLEAAVFASLAVWLAVRLKSGDMSFPKSGALAALLGVSVAAFISAVFSDAPRVALFGFGDETGTAFAVFTFFLLAFLFSVYVRDVKRASTAYALLLLSGLILALFQAGKFFGIDFLSFGGAFVGKTATLIGKWNDLAVFFGFLAVASLLSLQLLSLKRAARGISYAALVVSLFFLAVANFSLAWVLVGLFSLVVFVHVMLFGKKNDGKWSVPALPIAVFALSVLFLLPGNTLMDSLNARLGISQVEVRPSWSATMDIAAASLKKDPVLGVGPNLFSRAWTAAKPVEVNQTLFWNTDFSFGVGVIPSAAVTGGVLGILAWLVFLGLFLYRGWKTILSPRDNPLLSYLLTASFFSAVYFLASLFFYVPGAANTALAFAFVGMFIGLSAAEKKNDIAFSFAQDPRKGFIAVLLAIVLLIASVVALYFIAQRSLSLSAFRDGVAAFRSGDIAGAEERIVRAVNLFRTDTYLRALSEVRTAGLADILNRGDVSQDTLQAQFQATLGGAIAAAQEAVSYDETNYANHLSLGRVYEAVIPLKIEGAYENAKATYENALARNPKGPAMHIVLARLELANGNAEGARVHIAKALELKPNYTEAIFLLSQIEAQSGNIDEAISQAERASLISPNDIGVFFQLGFLRYSKKDYDGAISALERAVILNPVYANAKYFLGLAYHYAGRNEDAIAQFRDVALLNPDNEEVKQILSNLEAGRDPFASIVPPEEPPEEREEPPIEGE